MTLVQIVFLITAVVMVIAALRVVTTPNLIHAALWLIVALFGGAVMYVLLEAPFLAVAQVVIYIGAIAILMIFAIMLTRRELRDRGPQTGKQWPLALVVALAMLAGALALVQSWAGYGLTSAEAVPSDSLKLLGQSLVAPQGYVIPFEVASVLLLAALIGAIYIAWGRRAGK